MVRPLFTLLAVEPGPDIASIHDRQMVISAAASGPRGSTMGAPKAELLQPLLAGSRLARGERALSESMKTVPLALSQAVSMPPIYQAAAEGIPSLARRAS